MPGLGTRATTAEQGVLAALSGQQADNVIGQGGAPSVRLSNGFTTSQLDDVIVPAILGQPGVVNDPALNGHDVFGTRLSPQITHFTTSVTINGNLSGFGILIVDQGLTMSGSSTFTGLIVVKGTTQLTGEQIMALPREPMPGQADQKGWPLTALLTAAGVKSYQRLVLRDAAGANLTLEKADVSDSSVPFIKLNKQGALRFRVLKKAGDGWTPSGDLRGLVAIEAK